MGSDAFYAEERLVHDVIVEASGLTAARSRTMNTRRSSTSLIIPQGGNRRGNRALRGVFPRPTRVPFLVDAPRDALSTFSAAVKSLLAVGLRRLCSGGALCRPLSLTGTPPQLRNGAVA